MTFVTKQYFKCDTQLDSPIANASATLGHIESMKCHTKLLLRLFAEREKIMNEALCLGGIERRKVQRCEGQQFRPTASVHVRERRQILQVAVVELEPGHRGNR